MYLKCALAAVLTLAPLGAADFWEQKKFPEWSEKQCHKLLEDSPWAKPVTIIDDGRRANGGSMDAKTSRPSRDPQRNTPPEAAPTATAYVRWHTAMPVKEAVARLRFGDAAGTDPKAAQMINRPEDRYVLGLANLPAGAVPESVEELKTAARLKVKGKPDLLVETVQPERSGRSVNLYLTFPRMRDGAPVIELKDGEVEFELRLPDQKISRKFKLKDMVVGNKLEI